MLTAPSSLCIIQRQIEGNNSLSEVNVQKLLGLSHRLERLMKQDSMLHNDEGAVNMRDLSRFLKLYERFLKEG